MKALSWTIHIAVGLAFAVAGVMKLLDPEAFVTSILSYEVFGYGFAVVGALTLPYLELCVGISLATGALRRGGRLLAVVLAVFFLIMLSQAAIRGLNADCGCFGSSEKAETSGYAWPIVRDLLFLLGLYLAGVCERKAKEA